MTAAEPADWDTEYLDKILAVAVVESIDEAIAHITRHGSGHTEAIVTSDLAAAQRFVAEVDSSAVMVNASTRFNDGGQLGLGAEIGISTDKIHARGPCGLRELTSTKWIVFGDGQIRAEVTRALSRTSRVASSSSACRRRCVRAWAFRTSSTNSWR